MNVTLSAARPLKRWECREWFVAGCACDLNKLDYSLLKTANLLKHGDAATLRPKASAKNFID
jgi:hypothetical protein